MQCFDFWKRLSNWTAVSKYLLPTQIFSFLPAEEPGQSAQAFRHLSNLNSLGFSLSSKGSRLTEYTDKGTGSICSLMQPKQILGYTRDESNTWHITCKKKIPRDLIFNTPLAFTRGSDPVSQVYVVFCVSPVVASSHKS